MRESLWHWAVLAQHIFSKVNPRSQLGRKDGMAGEVNCRFSYKPMRYMGRNAEKRSSKGFIINLHQDHCENRYDYINYESPLIKYNIPHTQLLMDVESKIFSLWFL